MPSTSTSSPTATAQAPSQRRLSDSTTAISPSVRSLRERIARLIGGFKLEDILSTRHHTDDFIETRAEFIEQRLRFMVLFYAIAVPLWIPADYLLISAEHFGPMVTARLVLTAVLLTLGLLTLHKMNNRRIHALLLLTIAAPTAFYVVAMRILHHGVAEIPLAGYSYMPFLMVAMLGVFPLTVAWGLGLTTLIVLMHLVLVTWLGQLATVDTFNALWVFALFAGVTLWIQSGQLLMLLRLYRESTQDPLTGIINRRVLMKRATQEIERMREGGAVFSLLMFDLDRFKRINDNHGHLTGDEILKTTSRILQSGLRPRDIVARFGGEEFGAVLPGTASAEAVAIAERLRQECFARSVSPPRSARPTASRSSSAPVSALLNTKPERRSKSPSTVATSRSIRPRRVGAIAWCTAKATSDPGLA